MSPSQVRFRPRVTEVGPAASAGSDPAVVALDNLEVTLHRGNQHIEALRGVSLSFRRGEIVGLVGESGSGKSVLALTLLGLLPARSKPEVRGSAQVCGVDMARASQQERRAVRRRSLGAVFQDPMTSLNPTMRIGRQVIECCSGQDEAIELLDTVGVPDPKSRLRSYPHELSGGLRQRVMIAMAIAGRPQVVIADEPTTSLDVTVQAQILDLIRSLCDEFGTTFMLVTHDLGVAAQVADRVAVLYGGRLAELGGSSEVLTNPLHPYTAGLMRSRITMHSPRHKTLPTIVGEPPNPAHLPLGCPFAPRCAEHIDRCDTGLPPMRLVPRTPGRSTACVRVEPLSATPPSAAGCHLTVEPTPVTPSTPNSEVGATIQAHHVAAVSSGFLSTPLNAVALTGPVRSQTPTSPDRRVELSKREEPTLALHVQDVHKSFTLKTDGGRRSNLQALRGVDLKVTVGQSVALVGESGCGKSTLLRLIAGLQTADQGVVSVAEGPRPQMVFQDAGSSLTPWLTVDELVGERLRTQHLGRASRRQRVRDALSMVGLPLK